MQMVMQHEFLPVPIAHAEMNWQLRTGAKSILADVLLSGINCPESIEVEGSSCLIIDGNALIVAIGKPQEAILLMYSWVLSCIMAELVNKYMYIRQILDRFHQVSHKRKTHWQKTSNMKGY